MDLEFLTASNDSGNEAFEAILSRRLSRRAMLQGGLAALALGGAASLRPPAARAGASAGFAPVAHSKEDRILLPPGYSFDVVIRWGDPLFADAPGFDPAVQSVARQARQLGYNCDFVGYLPLPLGSRTAGHGLLVINQEYTNPELMFPGWDGKLDSRTKEMVDIEMAAHGVSIVEVRRGAGGRWTYLQDSPLNRRLTAETPMRLSGPAAGHPWMRTSYDAAGASVRGTLNNCAGGVTPWGTVLSAEENFPFYFGGALDAGRDAALAANHKRYGFRDRYGWGRRYPRFDLGAEPHEPLRFGWVVEIDPYDPRWVPVKRTALGRARHEAATVVLAPGGQVVVYSGDDERFEYIYKFVSAGRYDATKRASNLGLLDSGILYVARFRDDGSGEWLPVVFGQGPLTPANGFASQAEVLINTRRAADLLGATKMDRPEDIEAHPTTGKVYAVMTSNTDRKPDQVDRANPRPNNRYGHILEMTEEGGNHAATQFRWEVFILCGDPGKPEHRASYQGHTDVSWLATPDNVTFDEAGRLWISTDGQPESVGANDGVYVAPTEGPGRGATRMFLSGPAGCEICGPEFTPDNRTLFVAIQHPGEGKGSTFAKPLSRFPDYRPNMPPRPSVVAIFRPDGGVVGG